MSAPVAHRVDSEEVLRRNQELEARVAERTVELQKAKDDLESFVHSVSHDLRAPLRGIMAAAMMLLEDYPDRLDDTGKDHLNRVSQAASRMARLIDDLLDYSRVGRKEMTCEKVDLRALADHAMADLRARDAECGHVVYTSEAVPSVDGDPKLLELVVWNLLSNACKFTKEKPDATVEFGSEQVDGDTVFYVRDNGVGFDARYADKLFRPFERLHAEAEYPGTGIGLANARRIIERHGGRVLAEGTLGQGATIRFTIGSPLCEPGPKLSMASSNEA